MSRTRGRFLSSCVRSPASNRGRTQWSRSWVAGAYRYTFASPSHWLMQTGRSLTRTVSLAMRMNARRPNDWLVTLALVSNQSTLWGMVIPKPWSFLSGVAQITPFPSFGAAQTTGYLFSGGCETLDIAKRRRLLGLRLVSSLFKAAAILLDLLFRH